MSKTYFVMFIAACSLLLASCSSTRQQQKPEKQPTPAQPAEQDQVAPEWEPLFSTPSPVTALSSSPYLNIKAKIDSLVPDSLFPPAHLGIKIVSLRTKETLDELNAGSLFNPASNQKLYTTATALDRLGDSFQLPTVVSVDTSTNTIYIKGFGDGVFSTENLDSLAKEVHRVLPVARTWRVMGDVSYFDSEFWGYGWNWDDEPEAYQMFLTPLILNGNTIRLSARPGRKAGDSLVVAIDPPTSYVSIENNGVTRTDSIATPVKLSRKWRERSNVLTVEGDMLVQSSEARNDLSVWQPERYTVQVFADLLGKRGVAVFETGIDTVSPNAFEVARYAHTLDSVVTYTNKVSDNLSAESLLKVLGAELKGVGSAEAGIGAVKEFLAMNGVDTMRIRIVDGSGLSRMNLISPASTVGLLQAMYDSPHFNAFYKSLPIAGIDGTIRSRMRRSVAAGNLRAKTGTLSSVTSLSGYVQTADREWLAFSVMMMNYTKPARIYRQVQDRIGIYLGKLRRPDF